MKNSIRLFGIIAIVAVIGFGMTACDNAGSPVDGNGVTPVITITAQPVSEIVTFGAIAGSLSVTASVTENATLTFQWQRQDGGSWENVGTNSNVFPIPAELAAGVHTFRVVVSASGGAAALTSSTATVTVTETSAETRTVTVNITGTGAEGVTHNAPATILQSATQLVITLSNVPANAAVTATNATVAENVVTFTFTAGASALTFVITVTAYVPTPTVILTPASVTINDGNLTETVNVTGTATGEVTLDTAALPTGVTATVYETTITVTGVRQSTAVSGTFTVGVTRQGVTQSLSVTVNLTEQVVVGLPTTPGLFLGAPETLTPASTPIAAVNPNLAAAITRLNLAGAGNDGEYTLLLNGDVTITSQRLLNVANRQLTIIGLGGERTIQFAGAAGQQAFTINATNARLTLGNNITLRGISGSSSQMIGVPNGNLIMLDGSKITGHTTSSGLGAVSVTGNGNFTMEGGEIIGNISTSAVAAANGGVRFQAGGNFTMNGGRIYGNFRNTDIPADVTVLANAGSSNTGGVPTGTPTAPITVNPGQPGIGVLNDLLNP